VDARNSWEKMRKSLGEKRKRISSEQIAEIVRLYGAFEEGDRVKSVLPKKRPRASWPICASTSNHRASITAKPDRSSSRLVPSARLPRGDRSAQALQLTVTVTVVRESTEDI
jgi:type I restriction-modification system DNA methylase subunit